MRRYSSLVVGTDGNPVISSAGFTPAGLEAADYDLKVYACGNTMCSPFIAGLR